MENIQRFIDSKRIKIYKDCEPSADPYDADIVWCADPVAHKALIEWWEDNHYRELPMLSTSREVTTDNLPFVGYYGIAYSFRELGYPLKAGHYLMTETETFIVSKMEI